MSSETLSEWIEAARSGDDEAVRRIFSRYGPRVRRWVGRRMGPALRARADSEDVLQSAMVAALSRLADLEFRGEGPFVSWLTEIAAQEVARLTRRYGAECRDFSREQRLTVWRPLVAEQTSVTQAAARNEQHARLREAIASLDSPDREAVYLRSFEAMNYAEIAERLDLPDEHAARYVYRRALKSLGHVLMEPQCRAPKAR